MLGHDLRFVSLSQMRHLGSCDRAKHISAKQIGNVRQLPFNQMPRSYHQRDIIAHVSVDILEANVATVRLLLW